MLDETQTSEGIVLVDSVNHLNSAAQGKVAIASSHGCIDLYARAYGRDAEFYSFYRGLQAYRKSLGKQGDVLVLAPEGEFFKYLKESGR